MLFQPLSGASLPNKLATYLEFVARTLSLKALGQVLSLRSRKEQPKIVMFKARRAAAIKSIIHIVPLAAASTLIIFNSMGKTFKDYHPTTNTALQFAAKLLELLIQSSLAAIYLVFVTRELLEDTPSLPLGSLFGPLQTTQLSYLWSLEFIGSLTSSRPSKRRRLFMFSMAVVFIGIGALVGPSAAVLLIPRPKYGLESATLRVFDRRSDILSQSIQPLPESGELNKIVDLLPQKILPLPDNGQLYEADLLIQR